MSEYIPFPACATDAPIDISFIFEDEKPAGKRGFVKTVGDKFEFEDGTIKAFKTKDDYSFSDDRETFKELVEFIDDYVNNGYELCDKTTVVLDDEDDLLVV